MCCSFASCSSRSAAILVILLFLFFQIGQGASSTSNKSVMGQPAPSSSSKGCDRSVLDKCLASIEPLLDATSSAKGIPHTQEAVLARCNVFKVGMSCIDNYKAECLNARQQQVIERAVAGARHTFAFLCDDPVFQAEFLQHQSCFRGTALDWEHCANHFQNLVVEEMMANVSRADKNLGLCCAKHGFLRCVYYSAQFKCRKDGALFLMKVAQTLTAVQVNEDACRRIKFDEMCAASSQAGHTSSVAGQQMTTHVLLLSLVLLFTSSHNSP